MKYTYKDIIERYWDIKHSGGMFTKDMKFRPLGLMSINRKAFNILESVVDPDLPLDIETRAEIFKAVGDPHARALAACTNDFPGYLAAFGNDLPFTYSIDCMTRSLSNLTEEQADSLVELYGGFKDFPLNLFSKLARSGSKDILFNHFARKYPQEFLDHCVRLTNQIALYPGSIESHIESYNAIIASDVVPSLVMKGYTSRHTAFSKTKIIELLSLSNTKHEAAREVSLVMDHIDLLVHAGGHMSDYDEHLSGWMLDMFQPTYTLHNALCTDEDVFSDLHLTIRDMVLITTALLKDAERRKSVNDETRAVVKALGLRNNPELAVQVANLQLKAGYLPPSRKETVFLLCDMGFNPIITEPYEGMKKEVLSRDMEL